jgi:hypothetical protein
MEGLRSLRNPREIAELRGLTVRQVLGMPDRTEEQAEAPADDAAPAEGAEGAEADDNASAPETVA